MADFTAKTKAAPTASCPVNIQWVHQAGASLPIVESAGHQWIALKDLAGTLGIRIDRLSRAATKLSKSSGVPYLRQPWGPSILRSDLPKVLAQLRPGHNSRLLALLTKLPQRNLGPYGDGIPPNAVQRHQSHLQGMRQALAMASQGAGVTQIYPAWAETTGLSLNSLRKVLRGTYTSRIAKVAHATVSHDGGSRAASGPHINNMQPGIEHCEPGQGVASNRVKRGRRSTLSEVTILEIRRLARLDPSTWHKKSLAHRFNSQPEVIEHILRGTYWTQAMKTALTAETSTANAPRRPLTQ